MANMIPPRLVEHATLAQNSDNSKSGVMLIPARRDVSMLRTNEDGMTTFRSHFVAGGLLLLAVLYVNAEERSPKPTPPVPGANQASEPLAKSFSLDSAVKFLDTAATHWQTTHNCFTCHTNYAYLIARPMIDRVSLRVPLASPVRPGDDVDPHQTIRTALEDLVEKRWPKNGPRWDAEVVMTAAVLALNDAATTKKLHPATKKALDRMWTVQRADGSVNWIKCDWPPMESDDDFAIPMLALAAGAAPERYIDTPAAKTGLEKIRGYLKKNPPPTLHHKAMLAWASSHVPDLISDNDRRELIKELRSIQLADGGWSLSSLGNWQRSDKSPQDTKTSDGYGTGFTLFVLRQSGVPADDPAIQRGIAWLKSNQRESGRWFTRSLHKDNKHYITHAGTAFAVMALAQCEPNSK
jgi:squalene-hopene/tetraprenyl-beta-curcumene cyclase